MKPLYPQESMMVVQAAAALDPAYPRSRPPAPPDTSYQRLRPVTPAPGPLPPPKPREKKPRLSQPPPPHPPTVAKAQPQAPLQVAVRPKPEELQVVLPQKPTFVPDHRTAPGCFDIVGRGAFPQIRFTTAVTI
jgi:hypothetical protein